MGNDKISVLYLRNCKRYTRIENFFFFTYPGMYFDCILLIRLEVNENFTGKRTVNSFSYN